MLLREYAIQPEVLTDLQSVRYFLDQTGVSKGRMISRYPKHWVRMVYDACAGLQPVKKASIEVRLKEIQKRLLPCGRPYDTTGLTWVQNALAQHASAPFSAVILAGCDSAVCTETVVDGGTLDERCPCWCVSREAVVRRETADMVGHARNLLRISKEIVFVDYFFSGKAVPSEALPGMRSQG